MIPAKIASRTNIGKIRRSNEDSIAVFPDFGLSVLADGMGGYKAGEVASKIAVEETAKAIMLALQKNDGHIKTAEVKNIIAVVNTKIQQKAQSDQDLSGMGTTIVVLLFLEGRTMLAHVGDSRIYRLRRGFIECMTTDHSLIQDMVSDGVFFSLKEAEKAGIPGHLLTRGLGISGKNTADVVQADLQSDDIYLLCSDGLTNMISNDTIRDIILKDRDNLEKASDVLLRHALASGGRDNISLILAKPDENAKMTNLEKYIAMRRHEF